MKIQAFGKRSTKEDCLCRRCTYTSVPEHLRGAEEWMRKNSGSLTDTELNVTYSRGKEEQGNPPTYEEGVCQIGDAQYVAGAAHAAVLCLKAA